MAIVDHRWKRQLVELTAHQGNELELASPVGEVTGRSSLEMVELGSIGIDMGKVFFGKDELVEGG